MSIIKETLKIIWIIVWHTFTFVLLPIPNYFIVLYQLIKHRNH